MVSLEASTRLFSKDKFKKNLIETTLYNFRCFHDHESPVTKQDTPPVDVKLPKMHKFTEIRKFLGPEVYINK